MAKSSAAKASDLEVFAGFVGIAEKTRCDDPERLFRFFGSFSHVTGFI